MFIGVDGERSKKWIAFAKKKLAALKIAGGGAKTIAVEGYRVKVSTDPDKISIVAPAAVVVSHIEFPAGYDETSNPGREFLYYADVYSGSAAKLKEVGTTEPSGPAVDGFKYIIAKNFTYNGDGSIKSTDARGFGVIFPTGSELYRMSFGAAFVTESALSFESGLPYVAGAVFFGLQTRFTGASMISVGTTRFPFATFADMAGTSRAGILRSYNYGGGWQLPVDDAVFSMYSGIFTYDTAPEQYDNYNGFDVVVTSGPWGVHLPLTGIQILAAAGITPYGTRGLFAEGAYMYKHGVSARVCVLGSWDVTASVLGSTVFFFDIALIKNANSALAPQVTATYVGRCDVYGTSALAADFEVLRYSLGVAPTGLTVGTSADAAIPVYRRRRNTYADGVGGVNVIVARADATLSYNLAPNTVLTYPGLTFPPITTGILTAPCVYNGDDTNLCVLEVIDDGPCYIPAIYKGPAWEAIPMPIDVLLTVRPIKVSVARTVLIGLVWVAGGGVPGTYFAEFDTKKDATLWRKGGKISSARMTRPIVGLFGGHEYSKLAKELPGSFPVTTGISVAY